MLKDSNRLRLARTFHDKYGKMRITKHSALPFLTTLLACIFLFASAAKANLANYVRKYDRTTISREDLLRLSKYEHLIDYFCSFSFIQPRYKVRPEFIKALFLAESGCNPKAISPKKALGLGQILVTTGEQIAKEIYNTGQVYQYVDRDRLKTLTKEDLFDPAINTLLTCYLISKYNQRFNGKLDLIITAWNAGENTDSLKTGKPAPYSETLNLIGKVNGYYISLLESRKKS